MKYIHKQVQDHIASITINRPPLNILNSEAYGELKKSFEELHDNRNTRVVIITGEGDKAFCAGADIKEFTELNEKTGSAYSARNQSVRDYIWNFPIPVIAAVNGLALGGGCVLSMVCDIRIVSVEAKFSFGEINVGIIGGTQYAIRMIPDCIAKYLVYSGEMISADEAFRVGLVNKVVAPEKVLSESFNLAEKISSKSPLALYHAKRSMNKGYNTTLEEGLALEHKAISQLWGSEEKNEGVKAFIEKRKAVF